MLDINAWQEYSSSQAYQINEILPHLRTGIIQADGIWRRRHPTIGLLWVQQGKLNAKDEQDSVHLSEGLYLSTVQHPIMVQVPTDSDIAKILMYRLDFVALAQYHKFAIFNEQHLPFKIMPVDDGRICPLLQRLADLPDCPYDRQALLPLWHSELHYHLVRTLAGSRLCHQIFSNKNTQNLMQIVAYIQDNFCLPINFDTLAQKYGISRSVLYQKFKTLTGTSPLQYQKQLRLNCAKNLLIDKKLSIKETAYWVGYESISQFSREYKRYFGVNPKKGKESKGGGAVRF
ncbi:AraC family transcriptional regulator [Moraxella cuniculi]|uniref:L-rhamnose operon regulatory protein rhaS n=1 Tax=Moraxella cuniculi TaxID=34061 RepID=A0A3S4R1H9_9GAMM|nr:AraC family transcriptional regulator [Moraxella cuniculi]VEG13456.1 L-rhamnose operon regulatory protein rhaS [Moraxella cuniculi]